MLLRRLLTLVRGSGNNTLLSPPASSRVPKRFQSSSGGNGAKPSEPAAEQTGAPKQTATSPTPASASTSTPPPSAPNPSDSQSGFVFNFNALVKAAGWLGSVGVVGWGLQWWTVQQKKQELDQKNQELAQKKQELDQKKQELARKEKTTPYSMEELEKIIAAQAEQGLKFTLAEPAVARNTETFKKFFSGVISDLRAFIIAIEGGSGTGKTSSTLDYLANHATLPDGTTPRNGRGFFYFSCRAENQEATNKPVPVGTELAEALGLDPERPLNVSVMLKALNHVSAQRMQATGQPCILVIDDPHVGLDNHDPDLVAIISVAPDKKYGVLYLSSEPISQKLEKFSGYSSRLLTKRFPGFTPAELEAALGQAFGSNMTEAEAKEIIKVFGNDLFLVMEVAQAKGQERDAKKLDLLHRAEGKLLGVFAEPDAGWKPTSRTDVKLTPDEQPIAAALLLALAQHGSEKNELPAADPAAVNPVTVDSNPPVLTAASPADNFGNQKWQGFEFKTSTDPRTKAPIIYVGTMEELEVAQKLERANILQQVGIDLYTLHKPLLHQAFANLWRSMAKMLFLAKQEVQKKTTPVK